MKLFPTLAAISVALSLAVAAPAEATPSTVKGDFKVTGNVFLSTPLPKANVVNNLKRQELVIPIVSGAVVNSTTYTLAVPVNRSGVVTQIKGSSGTAISGGTHTLTISKNGGNSLLSTANVSPTILTANTATTLPLTGTPADLTFAAGDVIKVVEVIGTQSVAGAGQAITVEFEPDDY